MAVLSGWKAKFKRTVASGPPVCSGTPHPPYKKETESINPCLTLQDDTIELTLPMLTITLTRRLNIDVPHEVSIIVPRAEMRFKNQETELIYSSITVVHAPRHPPSGDLPVTTTPMADSGQLDSPVKAKTLPAPPRASTPDEKPPAVKITFRQQ